MKELLTGLRKFSDSVYPASKPLFEKLSKGQTPHTFMITCSDSRIDPSLITQTQPGEIFVLRNAGNLIPPFGTGSGAEEAAIEFAIEGLKVKNIVVCGHTLCGAMAGLMNPASISKLPSLSKWLNYADGTKRRVTALSPDPSLTDVIQTNVLVQIQHLKTHPAVLSALAQHRIQIYAWVYQIESGSIHIYDREKERFIQTAEIASADEKDLKRYVV